MDHPHTLRLRSGSYASFQALVNDTNDNIINPPPVAGDCYVIELDDGEDANGAKIHKTDVVCYDGTNWILLSEEERAEVEGL